MGHIKGFVDNLSNKRHESIPKSCLMSLNQISSHRTCVESMIQCNNVLSQIIIAISSHQSLIDIACEALNKMFQVDNEELVHQAIKAELVQHLLKILDSSQSNRTNATKAHIVEVLKTMQTSNTYGEQVSALLNKSNVWNEFREQKHDLFITNTQYSGYITGLYIGFCLKLVY